MSVQAAVGVNREFFRGARTMRRLAGRWSWPPAGRLTWGI